MGVMKAVYPGRQAGVLRTLRVAVLLVVLAAVAGESYLSRLRTTDWDAPLWVAVYPINADGSPVTRAYIEGLDDAAFEPIEAFLAREAQGYRLPLTRPMVLRLAPELQELPPEPPRDGRLAIMWWSLKMRYWAWSRVRDAGGPPANITLFVKYHDPARRQRLAHSVGLQKGLLGVVNAYASRGMRGQNQVIIAHELLHTVGASDKYDMQSLQPVWPEGYAEPERSPRLPQRYAELMGGRIPLSATSAEIPRSLRQVVIGPVTAAEIRWIRP